MTSDTVDVDGQYPGVDPAYAFVQSSYQFLLSRFEAADNRLTTLLTAVLTITLGVPLFAKNVNASVVFDAPTFIAGLMAAAIAAGFAVVGRTSGSIKLVDPAVLYRESLHKSPWTFKKDALYRAGEHFHTNAAAIALKGTFASIVTGALFIEVMAFACWLFL
jgi:hypothetical protein